MNPDTAWPSIGVRIPPCVSPPRIADLVAEAEGVDFDAAWLPDTPLMWRDPWVCLAVAAAATRRIGLGVAVTNPVTRHLAVTASAAASIAELAPGRTTVALGSGNSAVRTVGHAPARQADLRETLDRLRVLLRGRGRAVDFGSGPVRLVGATDPPPPVWCAATGHAAVQTAGAHADGVILDVGLTPDALTDAIAGVRGAAERAGRDPATITIAVIAHVRITSDIPADAPHLKPLLAGLAVTSGGRAALARAGIPAPQLPPLPRGDGPDWMHNYDRGNRALLDEHISDDTAAAFAWRWCLWGTPTDLRARLAALAGAGVDHVILHHDGHHHVPDHTELAALTRTPPGHTPAPRRDRGMGAWYWHDDPDAPYASFLATIETHCHPEAYEDGYDDLIHVVQNRPDDPEISKFTRQLTEVIINPALLPLRALGHAAEYDDGSETAFLHRLWRDLYPNRPCPAITNPPANDT